MNTYKWADLYIVRLPCLQQLFIDGYTLHAFTITCLHFPSSAAVHVSDENFYARPLKVAVVLAGAPETHARLSLRYSRCPDNRSEQFWDVLEKLKNFIPWKQLVAVTLRAGARVHTTVLFVANCLALARGGKIASLRVIAKRPGKRPELMEAAVRTLGKVVGGDPQASEEIARAPLGLTSLELWVEKRVFLEQLELRGRVQGLERIILHCPRTEEAWVEQMREQLPQLEVRALKGRALLEVNLPALDKAMRDDTPLHRDEAYAENVAQEHTQIPTPIHCLPAEILAIIFQISVEEKRKKMPSRKEVRWRIVALSTGSLWSTIDWNRHQNSHEEMREAFLHRSQQTPLDLRLCDDLDLDLDPAMLEYAPRVRNLSIVCTFWRHDHQRFKQGSSFLNLESLSTTVCKLPNDFFPTRPPKLHTIVIIGARSIPALSCGALTRLHLQRVDDLSGTDIRTALSACASTLKELSFSVRERSHSEGAALPPIHLPRLETLFARNSDSFLRLLSIPASTAVTLEDCHAVPDWFASVGNPTGLALDYGADDVTFVLDYGADAVTAALAGAQADARGTRRWLQRYHFTTQTREAAEREVQALIPWTQLESVALRATARVHTAMVFLVDGVRRARGGVGRLKSVYVAYWRQRTPEAVAAAVRDLGEVIGGDPQAKEAARREPLRLAKLEIWVVKRAFLEQLCLGGRLAGVERIVLHCPRTAQGWVERMQRELPQLEVHMLKGAAVKEATVRPPVLDDTIWDGMYR
ncbi:uncharacterized protein BXZ73DRAFT_102275 [Epithele typhae]|uniref:uncharacterized protein n=1 Tax=Epithele typhae TaxID=378194 RepID=UPI002008D2FB|nr:uncharacterized protein BXZ73DRAFT_102275 [Epithele typhae]KAH9928434.1 hypothetical protein BXZ73DRAFT_102275 [Epithele typhae]